MGRLPQEDAENRRYKVARMMPHHRGMARAMLAGATNVDLATRYGVSPVWVSTIVNSPLFKAELARLEKLAETALIDSEMIAMQPRAMEVIAEELFSEGRSKTKIDTAFKLLDRTGYHPKNEQSGDDNRSYNIINFAPMPGESPEEAKARLGQVRQAMRAEGHGDAVDAEFELEISGEAAAPQRHGNRVNLLEHKDE